ncbi:MAG: hypothetical protein BGN85_09700 [Alphaproteobacteria bacterium 64-11]|nr:hypothetical protein [Alphaproteobacteria bacterium]OJU10113.1 MAG: hypothetical protein BGN85_09700 [Alphaproteobacteria bacterium 64-11]
MSRCCALLLALAAGGAAAQVPESVTVRGPTGIWLVSGPAWLKAGLFEGFHWGPLRARFCRVVSGEEGLHTRCYSRDYGTSDTLESDGHKVHLAWGTMMARIVMDGEMQSPTRFTGHFGVKIAGIRVRDDDLSEGVKVEVDPAAPDVAGKAGLLRAILSGQVPAHETRLDKPIADARAMDLGAIQSIAYIGAQDKPTGAGETPVPGWLAAYAVDFDKGRRVCVLHQDEQLDAFECF